MEELVLDFMEQSLEAFVCWAVTFRCPALHHTYHEGRRRRKGRGGGGEVEEVEGGGAGRWRGRGQWQTFGKCNSVVGYKSDIIP